MNKIVERPDGKTEHGLAHSRKAIGKRSLRHPHERGRRKRPALERETGGTESSQRQDKG